MEKSKSLPMLSNRRKTRPFRLTLTWKLLLGYLSCGLLTVLAVIIVLINLQRLNEINDLIIKRDVPLAAICDQMIEAILAQDVYGHRALLLKSREMEVLFWKRGEEFANLYQTMRGLPDQSSFDVERVAALHNQYGERFKERFESNQALPPGHRDREIRLKQEEIIQTIKVISQRAKQDQNEKRVKTLLVAHSTLWLTAALSIAGLLAGMIMILIITRNVSRSIRQFKRFTQTISGGKFGPLPEMAGHGELRDLYDGFQTMAEHLRSIEEAHLDANPLTHLPGSTAIQNVLSQKLREKTPLAFCQVDLSNFKAFNDHYGYARGNEVIQATSKLITAAVERFGDKSAFVGHIGGDDFVVITSPQTYEKICRTIIESFDRTIPDLYDPADRERGWIEGETRQGQTLRFPVMSLAIAVVTEETAKLENHVQIGEKAADLKSYAKSFSHSTFVVDRRRQGMFS